MTEQKLVLRLKGFASRQATYHDKVLEDAGNITIDQDDIPLFWIEFMM